MVKIVKSMKKFIERGGEKGMKKLLLATICLGVVLYTLPAYALPTYNICHLHEFKFTNYERWVDTQGVGELGYGYISPGDRMYGILRVPVITDMVTLTDVWKDSAAPEVAELTGYFDYTVSAVNPDALTGAARIDFVPTSGLGGPALWFYYDTTPDWAPLATTPADEANAIAKATDGFLYGTATINYWYGIGAIAPPWTPIPPMTQLGIMYGGVDFLVNNTGYPWVKIDDSDEPRIGDPLGGPPIKLVDLYTSGKLHSSNTGGWTFRSEDPMVGHPTPEPASLLLLGSGLLGMAALGMRKKRLAS